MRIDPHHLPPLPPTNNLHYHEGCICHGGPDLQACIDEAVRRQWVGKVLEKVDVNEDGVEVKCYSMIVSSFDHWAKHGKFVAVVEVGWRML